MFLDLRRDLYQCLPGATPHLTLAGRTLRVEDPELARQLAAAGLIAPVAGEAVAAARVAEGPRRALPAAPLVPPSFSDLRDAASALPDILRARRATPRTLIRRIAGPPLPVADEDRLRPVVWRFQRWAPYAPTALTCLLRSYLLLRRLRQAGLGATWVFGVRTWPFAAHCWLQVGDLVLDDPLERLVAYRPILAV